MNRSLRQQIVISGVGGQGVLFVTRLMAEAAIRKGLSVLTSETHGMAQRGGTVISHLKLGDFSSPLIRAGAADGLLGLTDRSLAQHGHFLKPGAAVWINSADRPKADAAVHCRWVNADALAARLETPLAVNLILLGFALAAAEAADAGLFCTVEDLRSVLDNRLSGKPELLSASRAALDGGAAAGRGPQP